MYTQRVVAGGLGAGLLLGLLGASALVELGVAVFAYRETGSFVVPIAVAGGIALIVAIGAAFRTLLVRVDRSGVRLSFGPIARTVALDRIERVEATTYRALREFGGWGIRLGRRGWIWNVLGDGGRAVELTLKEGRPLLLSARDPAALVAAIEEARAGRP